MKNANDFFGNSNGSENFYRHPLSKMIFSDGVKDMVDTCGAYWLIDLVFSYQIQKKVRLETFQVWELKRVKDAVFTIQATDGNDNHVASQQIPFSDFLYDTATLWLVDGVLLLPSEY